MQFIYAVKNLQQGLKPFFPKGNYCLTILCSVSDHVINHIMLTIKLNYGYATVFYEHGRMIARFAAIFNSIFFNVLLILYSWNSKHSNSELTTGVYNLSNFLFFTNWKQLCTYKKNKQYTCSYYTIHVKLQFWWIRFFD